ncbi:gamma-glutamyl peptidase 5-like isoform X1 [Oryza brachyantha]|uniref:gamma-glutamyl peptidase 5-like isoform X1 n=1 Tax=Oryza brachyantha TaxID=4533 RepID=UPI001ADAA24B|nr:gamma-glutamyl peptidase 5-like isoform X1 [Oryza brachyantha]
MTVAAAGGGGGRRYALLLALKDSEYARKVYGGYGNVFMAALGGGGERWDCFRVVDGEFPAAEELGLYDGFVVSGSPHDAYGDDRWILRLCSLLRTLHAMNKRLLGICFGHQVLCRALGGRVGKARGGWDIGVKKVTFVPGLQLFGDLEELPQSASIIEVHQDEVWEVPPRGRVLAYSEKTRVEMFGVGDHVLGIQGHPEYTTDILHSLIHRLVNDHTITRSIGEEAQRTTEGGEPDREFWTSLCKGFLRGPSTPAIATPTVEIDVPSPEMTMSYSHVAGGHFAAAATVAL